MIHILIVDIVIFSSLSLFPLVRRALVSKVLSIKISTIMKVGVVLQARWSMYRPLQLIHLFVLATKTRVPKHKGFYLHMQPRVKPWKRPREKRLIHSPIHVLHGSLTEKTDTTNVA